MLLKYKMIMLSALACSLSSCATIISGSTQSVSVQTTPEVNATCTLKNKKNTWTLNSAERSVVVDKAYSALDISCDDAVNRVGYSVVPSKTNGVVFGNVVLGGLIGGAVDMYTGAAYEYPDTIIVPLSTPTPLKITKLPFVNPADMPRATTTTRSVLERPKNRYEGYRQRHVPVQAALRHSSLMR